MSDVSLWPILVKGNVVATDYIPVTGKRRLQVATLFPSLATVGVGSESLYTGISNQNQINFKGLLSLHAAITVATNASNLELNFVPAQVDLALCDNTTSLFLKTVNLISNVTGVLPVANGGTGLATVTKGSLLYADALDSYAATAPLGTDGLLAIGHTANGTPSINTLTAGANVTIVNGPGSITIAANITALLATLDTGAFGINLNYAAGASFISGDGTAEGITVDTNGRVFIGDSVPVLPALTAQLHLGGNATNAINIGNNSNYKAQVIKAVDATGANAGLDLSIEGASGGPGVQNGGNVTVKAGPATGAGTGGDLILEAGDGGVGTPGSVLLKYSSGGVPATGLKVDLNGNVSLPKGFLIDENQAQILIGAGAVNVTESKCHFTDTGANALTLADGVEGQHKYIFQVGTAGGAGTLTPTNFAGGATITFNAIGDTVHLMFTNGFWFVVGQNGVVIA